MNPQVTPESVWDYPRPPRVEPCRRRVRVEHGGETVAESAAALRVLETASPPTIYVPAADVREELLAMRDDRRTLCEWKGPATYFDVSAGGAEAPAAAWAYLEPRPAYAALKDHYAFYPGRVDACWLDEERVRPQGGDFYGGWVTDEIQGPWKGEPGTEGW